MTVPSPVLGRALRASFPVFRHNIKQCEGVPCPFAYLDSAVSSQKPQVVIDAMVSHAEQDYGAVHRGAYGVSMRSSQMYETARAEVAAFLGATVRSTQVVFTRGSTESLNIAANGIAETRLDEGSRIVVAASEHHANLVPWQQAALRRGCEIAYIPLKGRQGADLALDLRAAEKLIGPHTKVVALAHVGNVLGQVNPVREIAALAKARGAVVVLDAAQSVSGFAEDPFELGADVVAFGAHKMYGPSGIGILAAKERLLAEWPPLLFGGGMVSHVTLEGASWAPGVAKFEAGTPPITEVAGFRAAIGWLNAAGRERIHAHAAGLASQFREGLARIPELEIFSPASGRETLVSFRHKRLHAHDLATVLDYYNVAVRAGHHCAWPLVQFLGVDALVRASFAAYSDADDVTQALEAIKRGAAKLLRA